MTMRLVPQADMELLYRIDIGRYNRDVMEKLGYTQKRFQEVFEKFPSIGFECNGKAIGGMVFDGNQVHLVVHPDHHGRWAILWKDALRWMFSLKNVFHLQIERHNEKCLRFMDKNNWPRIGADNLFITFEATLEASPYHRPHSAKSTQRAAQ